MNEERMKVLEMLSEGVISVDEAHELLKSLDKSRIEVDNKIVEEGQYLKDQLGKFLYIIVESSDGDKVNVTLPMALIKSAIKIGNVQSLLNKSLPSATISEGMVDIDLIIQCIESGIVGNIVDVESKDGDSVKIFIK